jgi:hypothetical protein
MAGGSINSSTSIGVNTMAWPLWNTSYTMSTISVTSSTTNGSIWTIWTGSLSSTSITSNVGNVIWTNWSAAINVPPRPIAAEALAAQQRDNERRRRLAIEADGARRRAEALLRGCLTDEQREDLEKKNCFYLRTIAKDGAERRYRIDRGTHGNVKLLDKDGRILGAYCVQPRAVPTEDAMLAQKLWLEHDEEEFKKKANFTPYARAI